MDSTLSKAVRILRAGGLVAFPTETVYGLGADATNPAAVRRIFAAKGRPPTNPIIVHVADEACARRYARIWPATASALAEKFWPGPLTLVVPRAETIAPETSAGRGTVGLRAPDHPVALELLRAFDGPVAAPSANRSTRVSPTTAEHVREELGSGVDLILDGGACRVGIESTVLDLSGDVRTILRHGGISQRQIEAVIGPVEVFQGSVSPTVAAISPGQHAIHYAPRAAAFRFDQSQRDAVRQWCRSDTAASRAMLLLETRDRGTSNLRSVDSRMMIELPNDPQGYARELYASLRRMDQPEVETILVEMPPDEIGWAAVRDRLARATRPFNEAAGVELP